MKIVAVLYPGGAAAANPELLGCAENVLGLRTWLEGLGHELVALTDKETELDKHVEDAHVVITTPFWPAYMTRDRIERGENLRLILTAGIGSDHIDLAAAAENDVTVAEITGSNVVSVAEHVVMQILALVRNYIPSYRQVVDGKWDIADIAAKAHDLEGKRVGIVGAGRIGQRTLIRLKPFDVDLVYYDNYRMSTADEVVCGANYLPLDQLVRTCDVISINCPLTPETDGLFDRDRLFSMKKGSWLVNTARGKIVQTDALVEALEKGHLAGYAGDVWYPQPAPADHPWRTMPLHAMTPHVSGTTLEAQQRYADGVRDCLERWFADTPIERDYLIVDGGRVVSQSYAYAFDRALATV
jgi:formate dehydrogenase